MRNTCNKLLLSLGLTLLLPLAALAATTPQIGVGNGQALIGTAQIGVGTTLINSTTQSTTEGTQSAADSLDNEASDGDGGDTDADTDADADADADADSDTDTSGSSAAQSKTFGGTIKVKVIKQGASKAAQRSAVIRAAASQKSKIEKAYKSSNPGYSVAVKVTIVKSGNSYGLKYTVKLKPKSPTAKPAQRAKVVGTVKVKARARKA